MSNRDTQFQGFAKLLFQEMQADLFTLSVATSEESIRSTESIIQQRIARWAYDLIDYAVCHIAMGMSNDSAVMFVPRQNAVNYIPDMAELPKEQDYGDGNSVVHPVPPIEVWDALVAKVEKSASTHPYKDIAMNVLSEMRKYAGYTYAVGFKTPMDVERLAIAIQRFVEKQEG